ncbi:phosphopentomutase [Uliginosibacterium sp. TH139]|uniref:phosphopentomutase n=1 Tax=Uliginosibacterium sp. TH139 TaxID=2067453 RepID=UPI000C7D7337|nr:phosphopentomutase [Uliginosibacterium sp. TH139]PLK48012.1 phosphopentomutase [Uliginosibacterium sp. TH139]
MARAIVVVLDSLGIGATPDAGAYGDAGANTLGNIAARCAVQGQPLKLPNLARLGLPQAAQLASGVWPQAMPVDFSPVGAWAAARERSRGKDTPSGHWELMGCPVEFDWGYFPRAESPAENVFPAAQLQRWLTICDLPGSLGNTHASGTEIIECFGDEHVRTGWPICYTSSDSVFQIAAHEEHFGLARLYDICEKAKVIFDELNIARVIARPFVDAAPGQAQRFRRTGNRHDYTTPPVSRTLLDALVEAGREVHGVGKIRDIFAARGVTHHHAADGNAALCEATLAAMSACASGGMVFANLVDFDMLYGHRRDIQGYADALREFDAFLPRLLAAMQDGDVLVLTADHGCDPSWPGSDHTREHVPLLFAGAGVPAGRSLGVRESFADLAQTLAAHLGLAPVACGEKAW